MTKDQILLETRRFRVLRRGYRAADGTLHQREVVEHPGAVTILPLLEGDRVCLIRNVRPAVGEILIELPAGTLEPGEPPLDTAFRELEEETGYRANSMKPLAQFFMSPGILSERMHLFLAQGLFPGKQSLDEGEEITKLEVPWEEAMRMVDSGEIRDSKSLVGLLHYDRIRRREKA